MIAPLNPASCAFNTCDEFKGLSRSELLIEYQAEQRKIIMWMTYAALTLVMNVQLSLLASERSISAIEDPPMAGRRGVHACRGLAVCRIPT